MRAFLVAQSERQSSGCLIWTGLIDAKGYGKTSWKGKTLRAHRLSYELNKGSIPEGQLVCHACDVPGCIEPIHLFLGDHSANTRDMLAKDRKPAGVGVRGDANQNAKLNERKVRLMRLMRLGGETLAELAHRYGVTKSNVSSICRGKTWRHINNLGVHGGDEKNGPAGNGSLPSNPA